MNIHEHQAKDILKKFGAPVPTGVPIFSLSEIDEKVKNIKTSKIVLKAQIHAGGRGKAGGVLRSRPEPVQHPLCLCTDRPIDIAQPLGS